MSVTVRALFRYPVKGCAPVELTAAEALTQGLADDRRFMLVEPDGSFLSQRKVPAMAVLRPRVAEHHLLVDADDAPPLTHEVRYDGALRDVSLFGKWFGHGVDQGDAAADWFSARLGGPCRLVRTPPGFDRDGWGLVPGKVGYADGHAVLVCAVSTLDELNARILGSGGVPVPMNRFRPNVVLDGWPEPHTEDLARSLTIGGAEFAHSARCVRCAVPTVDQATGTGDGPEPTRTLATYRREPKRGGGVSFGVKLAVVGEGAIKVGDTVTVHGWLPRDFTATKELGKS